MFMDNIYWILWESQPSISLELNNGALFQSFRPPVRGEHPLPCPFGGKVPLEVANLCVKSGPRVKFHTLPETNGQSPRKPRKPLCQRNPFSGAQKTVSFKEGFMCFRSEDNSECYRYHIWYPRVGIWYEKNYHDWNYEYKTSQKKTAVFFE